MKGEIRVIVLIFRKEIVKTKKHLQSQKCQVWSAFFYVGEGGQREEEKMKKQQEKVSTDYKCHLLWRLWQTTDIWKGTPNGDTALQRWYSQNIRNQLIRLAWKLC